jgi:hypothetical protein
MNLIQIENLRTIIDAEYPHICLNQNDCTQFINIPWEAKRFYKFKSYNSLNQNWWDKKGFFHNGKTTIWAVSPFIFGPSRNQLLHNELRIADKEIPVEAGGTHWSPNFSFQNEGDASRIMKIMKLKAFW